MFWQEEGGPRYVGRAELTADSLELEATVPSAPRQRVAFVEIAEVTLTRSGLSVMRRTGPPLLVGSLDRPGVLRELADLLASAISR